MCQHGNHMSTRRNDFQSLDLCNNKFQKNNSLIIFQGATSTANFLKTLCLLGNLECFIVICWVSFSKFLKNILYFVGPDLSPNSGYPQTTLAGNRVKKKTTKLTKDFV